jgi:hypothetical protein
MTLVLAGCVADPSMGSLRLMAEDTVVADSISATEGSLSGGDEVVISGTGLASVTSVTVDGEDAPIITRSNESVVITIPHSREYVSGETVALEVQSAAGIVADFDYTYRAVTAVDWQLEYAFRYWNDYNLAEYGDFNTWGGDCMNFVSQTLVARGWAQTDDWFNDAQEDWAAAFVHVPSFDEWLSSHPELGAQRWGLDRIADVTIGDVVLFDWDGDGSLDHAQIVSSVEIVDGVTEVFMVGHNLDSDYRSITDALELQGAAGAEVVFWSIP